MTTVDTPHFDIPFRFEGNGVPVVEQDTYEEIANGVEIIIRTPLGARQDHPDFGIPRYELTINPTLDANDIIAQEPRVPLLTAAQRSAVDSMISTLTARLDGPTS